MHIPQCPHAAAGRLKPQFGADKPWLAPLAGYSDLSFRLLCREYGAATCVTEMVSAAGLYYQSRRTGELLASIPADQPLVVQLFGGDAAIMGHAVSALRKAGYSWFDCNLGCSVRKMLRQNAGASLLGDPDRIVDIARAMVAAARQPAEDNEMPGMVGFKLRLGLNPQKNVLPDLALRLEDAGAAWLALHPRYASQGFTGRAQWEIFSELSTRLGIPLLASGDLFEAEDGVNLIASGHVSGVMYARGALRNPAIFRSHLNLLGGGTVFATDHAGLRKMIDRHLELARKYCAHPDALLRMRSIVPRYARLLPGVNELRRELCVCTEWEEVYGVLDRHLGKPGACC